MNEVTLIVPCYNEAERLDGPAFVALAQKRPGLRLLFVDDGSTDRTKDCLIELSARWPERLGFMSLCVNSGKAEAVRQGLRTALSVLDPVADLVGYVDADLATPGPEILRLIRTIETRNASVVMGARVALLGSSIQRTAMRHYSGRVFATVASVILDVGIYDSQCGAKVFRRSPALDAALETPFLSRWAFDLELLGRLLTGAPGVAPLSVSEFIEVPLSLWRDVPGSKLRAGAMVKVIRDLAVIRADLRRRRKAVR